MSIYLGAMGNSKSSLPVWEATNLQDLPGLSWLITQIKVSGMNGSGPFMQELRRQHGSQFKVICCMTITLLVQGATCGSGWLISFGDLFQLFSRDRIIHFTCIVVCSKTYLLSHAFGGWCCLLQQFVFQKDNFRPLTLVLSIQRGNFLGAEVVNKS